MAVGPSRLVFQDETGATTAMARRYGRAPRCERVVAAVPLVHWTVATLTAAVRVGGEGGEGHVRTSDRFLWRAILIKFDIQGSAPP